jgi:hypothetical protein
MQSFKIKLLDFIKLLNKVTLLTRGNNSELMLLNIEQNKLTVYYKNQVDKTGLKIIFSEVIEIESSIKTTVYLPVSELINVKLPSSSKKDTLSSNDITIDIEESKLILTYIHQWKAESKPSVYSLELLTSAEPKKKNEFKEFSNLDFSQAVRVQCSGISNTLKLINIYSSDATTKQANNILLKVSNNEFLTLSTDSTTAAKVVNTVLNSEKVEEISLAVNAGCLKILESFILKSADELLFYVKNKKVFVRVENSFMIFPVSSGEQDLEPYMELFDTLPEVLGEIDLEPLTESIKSLISNSKTKFFKLKLDGKSAKDVLNLSSADGKISNIPINLNKDITGLVDAYLLTNVLSKIDKKDTINIGFDTERNLWCLQLRETNLTFLVQGMS